MDTFIHNLAPDSDTIVIECKHKKETTIINIFRTEDGRVCISVVLEDGTEHRMVLGCKDETTIL